MEELRLSFADIWLTVAILLVIVMLAFTVFYYRRTNPPVTKGQRVFLAGLRSVALVLLLFSLAEPVFSYLDVKSLQPHLAVLFDNSESTRTIEDFEVKSELLNRLVSNPLPGESESELRRDNYAFSDSLTAPTGPLTFDGKQTSLGDCLVMLKEIYKDRNLQGVVVISDGLVNSGTDPMTAASELAVPIYSLDLGPQKSSKDIRIVKMTHDDVGYEGKASEMELEIESRGFDELVLPIKILDGERILGSEEVRLAGSDARRKVTVEFVPPERGAQTFAVSLPTQPEEKLTDNNKRSFSMKILKSKLKILIAAGYPSWELTFLKRVVDRAEDFEYDVSIFDRTGNLRTSPFPRAADELRVYDLVILIDYAPSILASKVEALHGFLQNHGKAVMFLLGDEFARHTPSNELAELLPYDFSDRLSARSDGSFHLQLTEQGKYHPVMQISEPKAQVEKSWASVPPFEQYLTVGREKKGATALAVHPKRNTDGDLTPLLTSSRVGKGKVLTTSFAPIWKMDFLPRGRGGSGDEYGTFVNNCIRWLTTTEDAERIRIAPTKPVFKSGERITFSASLYDESYQAMEDGTVILTVFPDSGTEADTLIASMVRTAPGKMQADFHVLNHGRYRYSADLILDDKTAASLSGKFTVEAFSLEEETLYEREDLLKELAATTGGRYYPISMVDSLTPHMNFLSSELRTRNEHPLAHNWVILLAALMLLSTEWAVRKRLQLL